MQRKTVLLLCGGESSEHDVSISSARNVFAAIDDTKFDVIIGFIDRHGKWWLVESIDGEVTTNDAVQLVPILGGRGFMTLPGNQTITPDVILPILHGKNGEDGSVQGLAQLLHIPIVGCDTTASAAGMDKVMTKDILSANGITVTPSETYRRGEARPDFNQLSMNLGSPLFIKPTRSGSSVGVSRVYSEDEFHQAIDVALEHSDVVLIERGISGRELEVAVLGNPPHHEASCAGEVVLGDDFYSYEEKYATTSSSRVDIPAQSLDESTIQRIKDIALRTYQVLGCSGLSRVDFFLTSDGTIYVNEINTMPGFTNISMYPKLWRHDGVTYSQLIERLIDLALSTDKS
ncbi:MAG: D-alanine--D-alanine ligase family protein [Candidatus Saccharimonadales bacterium]